MLKRTQDEGISRRATIEALENALRTHRQELRLQKRHLATANKAARTEQDKVKELQQREREHKIDLDKKVDARSSDAQQHLKRREEREARAREERLAQRDTSGSAGGSRGLDQ